MKDFKDVTKHLIPTNSDRCNHGEWWTVDCAECGRRGRSGGSLTAAGVSECIRLEMLERAVFGPVIKVGSTWSRNRDQALAWVNDVGDGIVHVVTLNNGFRGTKGYAYFLENFTWVSDPSADFIALTPEEQTETAGPKSEECYYCDKGFPLKSGMHFPAHALGMIPNTPCSRPIRAAEGVVLEPGEYEVVEISAWDTCPAHRMGERFTVITESFAIVTEAGAWWVAGSGTNKLEERTGVTAVRRVEPAKGQPEPPAECSEDAASCDCLYHENLARAEETHMMAERDAARDKLAEQIKANEALMLVNEELVRERDELAEQSIDQLTTSTQVRNQEAKLRARIAEVERWCDELKNERSHWLGSLNELARMREECRTGFVAEAKARDELRSQLSARDAELAACMEELKAERRACTQLQCDITNAWSRYSFGNDRLSDLCTELDALSKRNPHAKPVIEAEPNVSERAVADVCQSGWCGARKSDHAAHGGHIAHEFVQLSAPPSPQATSGEAAK